MQPFADKPFDNQKTRCLVALARFEDIFDFGAAHDMLDLFRTKLTGHFLADFIGQVIDHIEIFHLDIVAFH